MKTINLRDYYPSLYTSNCFIEVPDEVESAFCIFKKQESAYRRRRYYNKAQYSLDRDDGINEHILYKEPSAEDVYENEEAEKCFLEAVSSLPCKQARRIYAYYFLGIRKSAIARAEGVDEGVVRRSIQDGLRHIKNILKKFL